MEPSLAAVNERPQNGIAGLKYWKHDILAGLLVSLVSLPLSTGIAIASGAPPLTGLISAIIAGLLLPFLGGSYVTISGPAAGLAPAILAGMTVLAQGDSNVFKVGYPLLLAVIFMVGCVQVVLSLLKTAKWSAIFPSTVVEAMLASIGLLIIVKQLPFLMGVKAPGEKLPHDFKAHEFFEFLIEAPSKIPFINWKVFGLTMFCLALIFVLGSIKAKWAKVIPPQLIAVVVGALLGWMMGFSGPAELIKMPDNLFEHKLDFPHFAGLFADTSLLKSALIVLVTLTLIDGVESLATASAVDRIDPWRRKSDPNRVLLAMGISNMCSSVVGGLTIIPGGVKSRACIEGGGRTLWANFYNACFLIIYLVIATPLIRMIPYAALAAVLLHIGYKLCRPGLWIHAAHLGREQIMLFASTVLVTLLTDLLWGIAFGVVLKLLISMFLVSKPVQGAGRLVFETVDGPVPGPLDLFRNPVAKVEVTDGEYRIDFNRPLVCFNSIQVSDALANIPSDSKKVVLHLTDRVALIDHTSCDLLLQFASDFEKNGRGHVVIEGLDRMCAGSHDQSSLRLSPVVLDPGHSSTLSSMAKFGLGISSKPKKGEEQLAGAIPTPFVPDEIQDAD